jgi:hypothetical protein
MATAWQFRLRLEDEKMTTHTPGPWEIEDDFTGLQVYSGSTQVAQILRDNCAPANARLIAAAPDMLAALEHLRAIAGTAILHRASLDHQGLMELFEEAREAAFAAIAKATGA